MEKIKKRTIFVFLCTAFFAVLFGTALGLLLASTVDVKNTEHFSELDVALPTRLLDINGELITEFAADEKRELINIIDLPKHVIDALITREDENFFQHSGYNLKAIIREIGRAHV